MEVERIRGPRCEADNEVQPALPGELRKERDWVPQRQRALPFRSVFAILILKCCQSDSAPTRTLSMPSHNNLNALLPSKQVAEALLRDGPDACSVGLCFAAGRFHDVSSLQQTPQVASTGGDREKSQVEHKIDCRGKFFVSPTCGPRLFISATASQRHPTTCVMWSKISTLSPCPPVRGLHVGIIACIGGRPWCCQTPRPVLG